MSLFAYAGRPDRFGWICPRCSRVWAPHVDECRACNPPSTATGWATINSFGKPPKVIPTGPIPRELPADGTEGLPS